METPVRRDARRYRRRILAICIAVTGIGYVVTAPMFVDSVEADLEERVPDELADAGFGGLAATFSGQDGTLWCSEPLTDPESARQAAYDVWGVHAIELDRSCRVNTDGDLAVTDDATTEDDTTGDDAGRADDADLAAASDETAADSSDESGAADLAVTTASTTTSVPSSTAVPDEPTFPTVADALAGTPQLSLMSVLIRECDLGAELADPNAEPITLYAPSDEALGRLPADVLADVRADPALLRALILHHAAAGRLVSADFVSQPIEMIDGSTAAFDAAHPSIAGFDITVTDIEAANGTVHVIDGVIVPADLDLTEPDQAALDVRFDGTTVTLSGVAATEAVRATLTAAANADGTAVVDELTVDPDTGIDPATAERLAVLVPLLTAHLVDGAAAFDGSSLSLSGTYLSDADRDVVIASAADVGVEPELTPPPEASVDDAAALEEELNAFVTENRILFEPSSAVISPASIPVLDQIALLAQRFDGITLTVEGHTDSDGNPSANRTLSQLRALAVKEALVARGLPDESVSAVGIGSERPVVVDGVEDKAASRRVEFRVVTAP